MSPPTALRLVVRPLRAAIASDRRAAAVAVAALAAAASAISSSTRPTPTTFSHLLSRRTNLKVSPCLRYSTRAGVRFFSAGPPSKPPSDSESDQNPSSLSSSSSVPRQDETSSPVKEDTPRPAEVEPETSTSTFNTTNDSTTPGPELELPSDSEDRRHPLSVRFSTFMDNLQTRVLEASQKINDLTGYSAIEAIKLQNVQLESDVAAAQARLRAARHNYKSLTSHRAATQREVTTLLARKDTWNPSDLERFTTLYRLDHELEAQVTSASAELTEAETEDSKLSADLNAGILKRYHEEQIWSDRIRRQSTWGTWGLMGVNILLFLVLQFVAEPWRRNRLMKHIAAGEKDVMDEVRRELAEVKSALEASGLGDYKKADVAAAADAAATPTEVGEEASLNAEAAVPALVGADSGEGESQTDTTASVEAVETEDPAAVAATEAYTTPLPETTEEGEAQLPSRVPWHERHWQEAIKEKLSHVKETLSDPDQIKAAVEDLYSERRIDLRMRDASLIALQGVAAGATVVAGLALILVRSSRT